MLTVLLLLFPLVSAVVLSLLRGSTVKRVALLISVAQFLFSIYLYSVFCNTCPASKELTYFSTEWILALKSTFTVGLDGISIWLVLLTTFLTPIIILSSFRANFEKPHFLYSLLFLMQLGMLGVFVAYDCFLFYVFWELALIPIYFISALYGGAERVKVTLKFFVYTLFGSLLMLVAVIYLYTKSDSESAFLLSTLSGIELSSVEQSFVFVAFFIAFAIKIPIFPFHTWQPDTYTESPSVGTMLLSGIMLKMGIFGFIRWVIPLVPTAFYEWGDWALALSVVGVIYASIIAIQQTDAKRLVAYSSIAHVGLIAAGLFTGEEIAFQGLVIQMVNHGINVVGMFMVLDVIERRAKTRNLNDLGGIVLTAPVFAVVALIILLGNIALPLTNGFVGEFLLLFGIFKYNKILALIAGFTIIFGAVYSLRLFQKAMLGEQNDFTKNFKDLTALELVAFVPVVLMILVLGVYPNLIFSVSESQVKLVLEALSK